MAKVRIQARSADVEDAIEEHHPTPRPHGYHHDKYKHVGALNILARVWKKEGPRGWYQVSQLVAQYVIISDLGLTGNECTNHEGRYFTSTSVPF